MTDKVRQAPERNLALELVRVTEAAALAAARWQGRGDPAGAGSAATEAMSVVLNTLQMDGRITIGQGYRAPDAESHFLHNGQRIGTGEPPAMDVAVTPVEGTTLVAQGRSSAISVVAIAERGALLDPGPVRYMEKIVVGPGVEGVVDIDRPVTDNLKAIAKAKGESVRDISVVILDRPRHADLIAEVRRTGARISLIQDGDVAGSMAALWPESGVDVLIGIGGTAEGIITAAAVKCTGGEIQGRLWARNNDDRQKATGAGYDVDAIFTTDDFVKNDNCFVAATGITDGNLLKGVYYGTDSAHTESLVMRSKSGTVRRVQAKHRLRKLAEFSEVDYA